MQSDLRIYDTQHEPASGGDGYDAQARPVFFCGGSALASIAPALAMLTDRAVYLVTPFDSGGSSAVLRQAFNMPAVGDLRARLLSLANTQQPDIAALCALCNLRLAHQPNEVLRPILWRMSQGLHPLVRELAHPLRVLICDHLRAFLSVMPSFLNLAGASVGNLALTGGYLAAGRDFAPVLKAWSVALDVRGEVHPVVNACAHLCVRLADASVIIGQHRFTGKESAPIRSSIQDIWLAGPHTVAENAVAKNAAVEDTLPVDTRSITTPISEPIAALIREADLVCYPVGSFYSSVVAGLLPQGVGQAIAHSPCVKLFTPNPGPDLELLGHSLRDQIQRLLDTLRADAGDVPTPQLLNVLLLDAHTDYPGGVPHTWLADQGIRVIEAPLISGDSAPYFAAPALCAKILQLCRTKQDILSAS